MMYAVRQALHHFIDERIWKRIQLNGMAKDFSWAAPAREYAKLYEAAWSLRHPGQSLPVIVPAPEPKQARAAARNQTTLRSSN